MADIPEHFYREISDSIKLVFDLTSRIDERVKMLVEQHNDTSHRIDKITEKNEIIVNRIGIVENRVGVLENRISNGMDLKDEMQKLKEEVHTLEIKSSALEIHHAGHDNKWKIATDFTFKVLLAIIGAIIAWRLNK